MCSCLYILKIREGNKEASSKQPDREYTTDNSVFLQTSEGAQKTAPLLQLKDRVKQK